MKKMYKSLAVVMLCSMLALSGCVVAFGNRGGFDGDKSHGSQGCGCKSGMMLVSPDGKCWSVKVNNDGQLSTEAAACRGTAACKCGSKSQGCKCGSKSAKAATADSAAKPAGGCKMMQMGGNMQMQMGTPQQTEPVPSVDLGAKK